MQEEIKNINTNKKTKKDVRVSFRLYDAEDIIFFERFKKEILATGDSLSSSIARIIRNHLLEREKKLVWKTLQDDMFYAFRKALFASLIPFSNKLHKSLNKVTLEENLLNAKLNMLLNSNAHKVSINDNILNFNSQNLTDEPKVFENARIALIAKLEKEVLKDIKNEEQIQKSQKKFENYSKKSDEIDAEILQSFEDAEDVYDDDL